MRRSLGSRPLIGARCLLAAAPAVFLLAGFAVRAAAPAPQQQSRAVHGTVVDSSDSPIPSAIVYLKNSKTLAVLTYIADGNGLYRFNGLDPNVDYQIHAEQGQLTSAAHTISSFDSRNDIVLSLKVNRKKPGK
ncbi:MAG TPA: carboxypeptidase-like regulatory domain-containing protein [Candidatus Acidoferrales bacterium]|nr:carboxypeptidase-like regulatory domain-containing protein [Candidatus Acidoferrales bacterium]